MKRKLLILFTLTLTLITLASPVSSTTTDYCDTANDACNVLWGTVMHNCVMNSTNLGHCRCDAWAAYNACMQQFGCSGKDSQFLLEEGCGPQ